MDWCPAGRYIVIGTGPNPSTNNGDVKANHELRVYHFDGASLDGASLVGVASADQESNTVWSAAWSPTGNYIALGGTMPGSELRVYKIE